MARRERSRGRAVVLLLINLLVAGLVLGGLAALASGRLAGRRSPPVRSSGELPVSSPSAAGTGQGDQASRSAETTGLPRSAPTHLSIPGIGVDTPLIPLGLNPDGTLEVPTDFSVAGWYELGPSPGEQGAAVIAGHVDSKRGPAVFYRLGELAPGSLMRVVLQSGAEVLFRVYAVREYPKTAFPTSLVYGSTPRPELRLVTCGGPFDTHTGHYLDNIVVFARYAGQG